MESENKILLLKQYLNNIKEQAASPSSFARHLAEKYSLDVVDDLVAFIRAQQSSSQNDIPGQPHPTV